MVPSRVWNDNNGIGQDMDHLMFKRFFLEFRNGQVFEESLLTSLRPNLSIIKKVLGLDVISINFSANICDTQSSCHCE